MDYEDYRRATGWLMVGIVIGWILLVLISALIMLPRPAHAASPSVLAASRFAACEQTARNYLDAMYGMRIPNVQIEIKEKLSDPEHIAEFEGGHIFVLPSVEDCGVILHELVHWHQWHKAGDKDCYSQYCYDQRESQAYDIERKWKAAQKD